MIEKRISTECKDWGPDTVLISDRQTLTKVASAAHTPSELLTVIDKLKPRPEGVYVLINAVGASEYWGQNANGDAFPEWSLLGHECPDEAKAIIEAWNKKQELEQKRRIIPSQNSYGYKTFVTTAKPFILHNNKDPLAATGDVIAAAYNHHMHRVELIVFIYEARDPEGVKSLRSDQPVAWSMGARVPFDVCTVCHSLAKNRSEYCAHLLTSMGQLHTDGRTVGMINFFPHFFDISRVRVPAERSAWTLRKIASPISISAPKLRPAYKHAAMEKNTLPIRGRSLGSEPIDRDLLNFVTRQVEGEGCPDLRIDDDPVWQRAVQCEGMAPTIAALSLNGVVLRDGELQRFLHLSRESVPKSLDLNNVPNRLLLLARSLVRDRSMKNPEFEQRAERSTGSTRSATKVASRQYEAYKKLLVSELSSIVKVASSVRVRTVLQPEIIGEMFFKSAVSVVPEVAWLPFAVAITSKRFV